MAVQSLVQMMAFAPYPSSELERTKTPMATGRLLQLTNLASNSERLRYT